MQHSPLLLTLSLLIGLATAAPSDAFAEEARHGDSREFERQLAEHVPATAEQVRWLQQQLALAPREVKPGLDPAELIKHGRDHDNDGEGAQIELWKQLVAGQPSAEQWQHNATLRLASQRADSGKRAVGSWSPAGFGIVNANTTPRAAGALMDVRYAYDHGASKRVLFAGALGGGLWKQADFFGGHIWAPLTNTLAGSTGIGGFWVDPTDSNWMIVGTGVGGGRYNGSGLYRTTNGGGTWTAATMDGLTPGTFYKIAGDRFKSGSLYACTDIGFFRSRNYGQSWTREHTGNCSDFVQVSGAVGNNDGVMLLALWGGVIQYAAVDTLPFDWATATTTGITGSIGRMTLAAPANRGDSPYVYAMVTDANHNSNGVFRSGAYGLSGWSKISGALNFGSVMGFHANAIEVHPDQPAIVAAGMVTAWLTENGTAASPTFENIASSLSDHTDFEFVPSSVEPGNSKVVLANDGGVFIYDYLNNTVDASENLLGINVQLIMGNTTSMNQSLKNRDLIAAGLWDTGSVLLDLAQSGNNRIRYFAGADGGAIGLSSDNMNEMVGTFGAPWSRAWSRDGGDSWQQIDASCPANTLDSPMTSPWGVALEPTPGYGQRIYTYSSRVDGNGVSLDARIWRRSIAADPACSGWSPLHAGSLPADFWGNGPNDWVNLSVANNSSADIVYVNRASTNRVVVLTGTAPNMVMNTRSPTVGGIPASGANSKLQADRNPGRPTSAYFTMQQFDGSLRLAVTHNAGVTWTSVTGNINTLANGEAPQELIASSLDSRQLWLGTSGGVYQSDDGGVNWFATMQGLPATLNVTQLEYDPTRSPPRLILGSYGRGFYTREFTLPAALFGNGFE